MDTPSAAAAQAKRLELVLAAGLALRVEFDAADDRIIHAIALLDSTRNPPCHVPLMSSLEGDASDPWPPSPALQSLSLEELAPGRHAALLVGMAGRSHWSASIESRAGERALVFDIACRMHQTPLRLGSSYRVNPGAAHWSAVNEEGDTTLVVRACDHHLALHAEPAGEFCSPRMELRENDLSITPQFEVASGQTTIRWKYRLRFT